MTLVVRDVSRLQMITRIDPGAVQGHERALGRKGALLDARAFTAFFTSLIVATPALDVLKK